MKKVKPILSVVLGLIYSASMSPVYAQASFEENLAYRFRPFYKFATGEPYRPCNWEYIVKNSSLFDTRKIPIKEIMSQKKLSTSYGSLLTFADDADIRKQPSSITPYVLQIDPKIRSGDSWVSAKSQGAGMYAQVEKADDGNTFVITYWTLFAYNGPLKSPTITPDFLDSLSSSPTINTLLKTLFFDHSGDIIGVNLIYDKKSDSITRVSYSIHGRYVEAFNLKKASKTNIVKWSGLSITKNKKLDVQAQELKIPDSNCWQDTDSVKLPKNIKIPAGISFPNITVPIPHAPSIPKGGPKPPSEIVLKSKASKKVYFAVDNQSGKFQHLMVFIEKGSHEPWPNPDGKILGFPGHTGKGYSFVPEKVQFLGSISANAAPTAFDTFKYFNGRWGDPPSIFLQKMCFYKKGWYNKQFNIPKGKFLDPDPFNVKNDPDKLAWPPPAPGFTP